MKFPKKLFTLFSILLLALASFSQISGPQALPNGLEPCVGLSSSTNGAVTLPLVDGINRRATRPEPAPLRIKYKIHSNRELQLLTAGYYELSTIAGRRVWTAQGPGRWSMDELSPGIYFLTEITGTQRPAKLLFVCDKNRILGLNYSQPYLINIMAGLVNLGSTVEINPGEIPVGYTLPVVAKFADHEHNDRRTITVAKSAVENASEVTAFTVLVADVDIQLGVQISADYDIAANTVTMFAEILSIRDNFKVGDARYTTDPENFLVDVIVYVKAS